MFKLLKLIIAVVIVAALAGAYLLSSDSAKDKAKNAASELVSSAADSAKAKADSAKKGVKSRVGDVRKANDERMSKRR